jgi:hypothetical protein
MVNQLNYNKPDEIVIHCDGSVIIIVPDDVTVTLCWADADAATANAIDNDPEVANAANAIAFVVNDDVCKFEIAP